MNDGLKEFGKVAWGVLGILLLVTVFVVGIALAAIGPTQNHMKEHFKKVHHVECDHEMLP